MYSAVQGTIPNLWGQTIMENNIRKGMCMCMYDWVTLLYNRNWHNIVNQLYLNKKYKNIFKIYYRTEHKTTPTPN